MEMVIANSFWECFGRGDFLWAPGMGPYLLSGDLNYGPLVCRWLMVTLLKQVYKDSQSGAPAREP